MLRHDVLDPNESWSENPVRNLGDDGQQGLADCGRTGLARAETAAAPAQVGGVKISVVTAVFNRDRTIGEAIDSLASQTYQAAEHIIIDGASRDNTLAEIERHRHPALRVFSERDGGIYDALNKGMRRATGDVIGLLHSDDLLAHDEVLHRVATAFRDPDVQATYGDLDYVSAADPLRVIRHWRAGVFRRDKLRLGWMPPHPTIFLRRSVLERFGTYDTTYRVAADYEAILRWFGRGRIRAAYIPEVLVKMRVGGESNGSLRHILRKSREDYRALRSHGMSATSALLIKNLSKLPQFAPGESCQNVWTRDKINQTL